MAVNLHGKDSFSNGAIGLLHKIINSNTSGQRCKPKGLKRPKNIRQKAMFFRVKTYKNIMR